MGGISVLVVLGLFMSFYALYLFLVFISIFYLVENYIFESLFLYNKTHSKKSWIPFDERKSTISIVSVCTDRNCGTGDLHSLLPNRKYARPFLAGTCLDFIHFTKPSYQNDPDSDIKLVNSSHSIHCHNANSPASESPAIVRSASVVMESLFSISGTTVSFSNDRKPVAVPAKSGHPVGTPLAFHGVRSLSQSICVMTAIDTPYCFTALPIHSPRVSNGYSM